MAFELKPGKLEKFNGALIKCFNCGRVEALEAVNDFQTLDAFASGWRRRLLADNQRNIFSDWHCPTCCDYLSRNKNMEFYTAVTADRFPISKQTSQPTSAEKVDVIPEVEDLDSRLFNYGYAIPGVTVQPGDIVQYVLDGQIHKARIADDGQTLEDIDE